MNYIGIDIGGTNLKAGLVDDFGNLLGTKKNKVNQISDNDSLVWTLVSLIQDLCQATDVPIGQIA